MNYLVLRALKAYADVLGPHAATAGDVYRELRSNLLGNIAAQFESTGFFWEQYSDQDGKGKGAHPFTGWTTLISLVAAERYPPELSVQ